MLKAKLMQAGVLIAGGVGILAPSSALAIRFQWKVAGNVLNAGQNKNLNNLKLTAGTVKISGTDAKNNAYEVECTVVTKIAGSNPQIVGGRPGKSINNPLQLEGCSVPNPAGGVCKVKGNEIKTVVGLQGQIVEGLGLSKEKVLYAFNSANGAFATIEIEGAGCAVEANNVVTGTLLAEAKNPAIEVMVQKFAFEPTESENFSANGRGCTHKAGLMQPGKVAGSFNRVTVKGEISVELNPVENFGPF